MENAFDQFDAVSDFVVSRNSAENPFDQFDSSSSGLQSEPPNEETGGFSNMARLAGESAANALGDVAGAFRKVFLGAYGLDLPALDDAKKELKSVDFGGERRNTPEQVKAEFGEGDVLGTIGAVGKFSAETMAESIPYMINLPFTVISLSERIADENAKNQGKEASDADDLVQAIPFALGSGILERIGAKGIGGAGKDMAEQVGKEAIDSGIKMILKEAGKAGAKEGATEFFQEGVIEYIGERYGTDVALDFKEAAERGGWAALAGGTYGSVSGGGVAAGREYFSDKNTGKPSSPDGDQEQPASNQQAEANPFDQFDELPTGLPSPEGFEDRPIVVDSEGGASRATEQQLQDFEQAEADYYDTAKQRLQEKAGDSLGLPEPEGLSDRPILVDESGNAARATQQDLESIEESRRLFAESAEKLKKAKENYQSGLADSFDQISSSLAEMRKVDIDAPVDESRDELMTMIAKLGGLNKQEAVAQGIDPAALNERVGKRNPFRVKGKTFDEMAEALSQYGLFPDGDYGANRLLEMVSNSMAGNGVYSPAAMEHVGNLERLMAEEQDLIAAQEAISQDTEITDDERAYIAEMYEALRSGRSIEDVEAAALALDYNSEDASAFFENLSILGRLKDGTFTRTTNESEAGSSEGGDRALQEESAKTEAEQAGRKSLSGEVEHAGESSAGGMVQPGRAEGAAEERAESNPDQETGRATAPAVTEQTGIAVENADDKGAVNAPPPKPKTQPQAASSEAVSVSGDSIILSASGKPFPSKRLSEQSIKERVSTGKLEGDYKAVEVEGGWGAQKVSVSKTDDSEIENSLSSADSQDEVRDNPAATASGLIENGEKPSVEKIDDFGEKLEGARKDYASKMEAAKEADIANVPLSKSWPEPDYEKLVETGSNPFLVGFARAVRDEIPSKPRKGWKLKGWVDKVAQLREMAEGAIAGRSSENSIRAHIEKISQLHGLLGRAELYAASGHKKSLKGISFQRVHFSLYENEKDVAKWVVERKSSASAFSNMPRTLVASDTKEGAIEEFKNRYASLVEKKAKRAVRFDIYSRRGEKDKPFYIAKKIGRDVVPIKEGFSSAKEARQYRDSNQEELEQALAKIKDIPSHRKETNAPRVGVDYRNGSDVSPEVFAETFGFRGVQFGNFVENDRRQQDLNEAYDAFMDLAGVLNIPPKSLSLNGELGLAFGARGKGGKRAPKAHYEPGAIVINLTKRAGAGSLAHEWWHSLDNYFSRERGGKSSDLYATDGRAHDSAREEIKAAFIAIKQAVNDTSLKQRSKNLDRTRTKPYWSTGIEMTARSFESYVIEKLKDQGAANDYLANIVSQDYWDAKAALVKKDKSYPYPEAAEIPVIRAAYDNFFQVVETRKTDSGIALFRESGAVGSVRFSDAHKAVSGITVNWGGDASGRVELVASFSDLPSQVQSDIKEQGGNEKVRGIFHHGKKVYVVAENHKSIQDLEKTVFHEAYGHLGLHKLFGKDVRGKMGSLFMAIGGSKGLNEFAAKHNINLTKYAQRLSAENENGTKLTPELRNSVMMEELLSHLAEDQRPSVKRRVKEVVGAIRQWLRAHGFKHLGKVSDSELFALLKRAREAVTKDKSERSPAFIDRSELRLPRDGRELRGNKQTVATETDLVNYRSKNPGLFREEDSGGFSAPDESLAAVAIRKIQDKFKVLKDLQKNISESGGKLDETNDAYLAEELFHGKAENDLRLMEQEFVKPLADVMVKHHISREDLDNYLRAKHARERNAQVAKINPDMPDGGSGMTNAEAASVIAKVAESGKRQQYEEAASHVYAMLQAQRDLIRSGGLEDQALIDAWEDSYEFYVPLKGWADNEQDGRPRTGKGFNVAGKESKRAMGRSTESASPTAYAINDLTEKLIRKRKNEVGNALLKLIEDNPNPEYWEVFTEENPDSDRRVTKVRDPETGEMVDQVREQAVPMAMFGDSYFQTKRDGKTYYLKLHDDRLMTAMKNLGPESNGALIRTLGGINRILSSLNTSLNPEFVVSNFARDIQTAVLNLSAEQTKDGGKISGEKIVKQTVKDVPTAMRAIFDSLRGIEGKGKTEEWMKHFDEFRSAGAKTGWFDMKDIEGQQKALDKLIGQINGGIKGAMHTFYHDSAEWVENVNQSVENAVRLSAYVNARRAGISEKRAASLAKNMTVNFNRKGEVGTTLNALYMFSNASIQGVANFARTMSGLKGDGKLRWRNLNAAQKMAVGIMAGAYTLAVANRMAAGDDDDGENWYDKVPDYVKERNLVIMKSLVGGDQDGSYWKVPLPYGYNVFYVLGAGFESVQNNPGRAAKEASNVALATLGSFSPIGFQDAKTAHGLLLKNATPTVAKPVVEVALNENFAGSSIYSENFPFGVQKPESSLGRRSTPGGYVSLTKWLNEATGGSDYRSGAIDVNPDVLQHFVDFYAGGAGKFFGDKLPDAIARKAQDVEVEPHRVPFLGRLAGRVLPYEDINQFYERRNEIGQIQAELKALRGKERSEFRSEYREMLALSPLLKASDKRLKALRKKRTRIYEDETLSAKERDLKLKAVESEMKRVVDRFNKRYGLASENSG